MRFDFTFIHAEQNQARAARLLRLVSCAGPVYNRFLPDSRPRLALRSFSSELNEEEGTMPHFKLETSTTAILTEHNQRTMVNIPANALVTLVDGDAEGNGFVRVRFEDKVLSMFAFDLRSRGKRVWGQSA